MKPGAAEAPRPAPEVRSKLPRGQVIIDFAHGVRNGTQLALTVATVVARISTHGWRARAEAAADQAKAIVEEGPGQYKKVNKLLDTYAEQLKAGDMEAAAEMLKEIKGQTGQT